MLASRRQRHRVPSYELLNPLSRFVLCLTCSALVTERREQFAVIWLKKESTALTSDE